MPLFKAKKADQPEPEQEPPAPTVGQGPTKKGHATPSRREAEAAGDGGAQLQQIRYLRALLSTCRRAIDSVREHLEEHGVSVDIVFQVEQVNERIDRIEALLNECSGALAEMREAGSGRVAVGTMPSIA